MRSSFSKGANHAFIVCLLLSMLVSLSSCAPAPPTELIFSKDHRGLEDWYHQEAIRLRGMADQMRQMVKRYDDPLFQPSPKETKGELIAHCERFITYYMKAADEADALAALHRQEAKAIP